MGLTFAKLFSSFGGSEPHRIIMVGLDGAGKTTILYKLKLGEVTSTVPTIGFNVETVEYRNVSFTVWDVGGQDRIRSLWQHYYKNSSGIVFVVDCNDRDRLEIVEQELKTMLSDPDLTSASLLIFANKQDLPLAMKTSEIADKLNLSRITNRRWHVQGATATTGEGLYEGLDWLSSALK